MIELSHVYKTYPGPIHALRNIDLKIAKGDFAFLIGPSGAGKTSLFKIISAFDKVTSGQIVVGGENLTTLSSKNIPDYRRKIGVVFQDFKLIRDFSVFDNVALPLKIRGEKAAVIRNRVSETLELLGMGLAANQMVESLSGGEQQRTAIARALIHQPTVLIADEPTGNLDPALAKEIMDLLEKVSVRGTTVLVATHDYQLVRSYNKRIIQLVKGELTEASHASF